MECNHFSWVRVVGAAASVFVISFKGIFFIAVAFYAPVSRLRFLTAFCVRHVIYERQTNYNDQTPLTPHDLNSRQSPLDTEGASNCAENCGHISKFYLNLICVHVFLVLGTCTYVLMVCTSVFVSVFMFVFVITMVSSSVFARCCCATQ